MKCATKKLETVKQCPTCPWRVETLPTRDIPNYIPNLHEGLKRTISPGDGSDLLSAVRGDVIHKMACHYSKPGEEFPCAGWLSNQLGIGNNLAVRMRVMTGQLPAPEVDGPQHETFEETLCNSSSGPTSGEMSGTSSTRRSLARAPRQRPVGTSSSARKGTAETGRTTRRRASRASRR